MKNDAKKYQGDPHDADSLLRFLNETTSWNELRKMFEAKLACIPNKLIKIPEMYHPEMLKWSIPDALKKMTVHYIGFWIPTVAIVIESPEKLKTGVLSVEALKKAETVVQYCWHMSKDSGKDILGNTMDIQLKIESEKN